MKTVIRLADYTKLPGARDDGEKFYREVLRPAIGKHGTVSVDVSGTPGLPASFICGSFGQVARDGLARCVQVGSLDDADRDDVAAVRKMMEEEARAPYANHYGVEFIFEEPDLKGGTGWCSCRRESVVVMVVRHKGSGSISSRRPLCRFCANWLVADLNEALEES